MLTIKIVNTHFVQRSWKSIEIKYYLHLANRAVVVAQVVAHRTTDREVPGSIYTGSWAFFSSLSYQKGVLNRSLVEVQHY